MSVRKSPKIQKLVVNAIRKLQDVEGSTPREISNYISQEYDVPATKIQRQVRLALARALSYGILQRSKGGYYVCNRDFGGCQPQMEEPEPTEKCGRRRGRGHRAKRARSGKSRRRKSAAGGKRRSGRRSRRGKTGGRCGGGGGGKKSRGRRRRRAGKSRRRRRGRKSRSRRGRGGKNCAPTTGGGPRGGDEDFQIFSNRRGRARPRTASASRRGNRSLSSRSYENDRLDRKRDDPRPIDSPETLLD